MAGKKGIVVFLVFLLILVQHDELPGTKEARILVAAQDNKLPAAAAKPARILRTPDGAHDDPSKVGRPCRSCLPGLNPGINGRVPKP